MFHLHIVETPGKELIRRMKGKTLRGARREPVRSLFDFYLISSPSICISIIERFIIYPFLKAEIELLRYPIAIN
jgi:hypothetical protein